MPTSPPTLTAAPASPDRADRATFAARAVALDDFTKNVQIPELQIAINTTYNNAVEAAGSAAAAGAILWISGTTYAVGDARISPTNFQTYRRKTVGGGTTDPNLDGTNWALVNTSTPSISRSARTSNAALAAEDRGSLIDITSGTFSQTFDLAATLGSGWYCYIRNSGTGDITLDPNGAELIDGLASFVMYPGEARLVMCDGAAFRSIVLASFYRTFTTSGTFTKPPGYGRFGGMLFGAGAGGNNSTQGGGGGAGFPFEFTAAQIGTTQAVTIGAGGAVLANGGNSTFVLTAYGGKTSGTGGYAYSETLLYSASSIPGAYTDSGMFAGGIGATSSNHGSSIYGGGGGGGSVTSGASIYAGAGGVGAGAGTAPAGGGGSTGAGARGELRIWGIM